MDDERTRTSLLIDADKVGVDHVTEVLRLLGDGSRRLVHRRAYGSLDKARDFAALCQQHAIRFFTTTAAGTSDAKGTHVALAIDAIELARDEPGDEFVLVTADAELLPLVGRLRELGFYVCGYGPPGKSARDLGAHERVYDEFKLVAAPMPARARNAARKPPPSPDEGASSPPDAPAPAEPPKPAPRAKVAILRPPDEEEVRRILEAVPALLKGEKVELSIAAALLFEKKVLAKKGSSTRLFKKYPQQFELTPDQQPNKVQYRSR